MIAGKAATASYFEILSSKRELWLSGYKIEIRYDFSFLAQIV